jgi:hypothetical protein
MPGWDLTIGFSNALILRIFCDHVGNPSVDGNWDLWLVDKRISIGAGSACEVEQRTS